MSFRILDHIHNFITTVLPKKTVWELYGIRKFISTLFQLLPNDMTVNNLKVDLHFTSFGALPYYKIGNILDNLDKHHFIISIIPLQEYEKDLFDGLPITVIEGDYTPEQVADKIKQHIDKR